MRKIIASVLAIATVASLSVTAFAADTSTSVALDAMVTGKTEVLTGDTIAPDKTLYYGVDAKYNDEDVYKVKFTKGDNSSMIKKISMVEKDITDTADREYCVKIELNESMADKEFKMNPTVTFTKKADSSKDAFKFSFYINNTVENADKDYTAGKGGVMLKPVKNEDNEINWEDENNAIAKLAFSADSDVTKFFPKMSTKWDNSEYAAKFADQDAYIRSFVGTPAISATSRPVLTLYNPYVNDEDEVTVAAEDVIIYEVVDGALVDATKKFTATTNDDGDSVFTTKTRTLGTYIFAQAAATVATEEVPATDDGKVVPNTGR
ncbi:hypothetical protein V6615_07465 [Oscillospiraceae bacterium PP1C4]